MEGETVEESKEPNIFNVLIASAEGEGEFYLGSCVTPLDLVTLFSNVKNAVTKIDVPVSIEFVLFVPKDLYEELERREEDYKAEKLIQDIEAGLRKAIN